MTQNRVRTAKLFLPLRPLRLGFPIFIMSPNKTSISAANSKSGYT
jgi:hypothetical protein